MTFKLAIQFMQRHTSAVKGTVGPCFLLQMLPRCHLPNADDVKENLSLTEPMP